MPHLILSATPKSKKLGVALRNLGEALKQYRATPIRKSSARPCPHFLRPSLHPVTPAGYCIARWLMTYIISYRFTWNPNNHTLSESTDSQMPSKVNLFCTYKDVIRNIIFSFIMYSIYFIAEYATFLIGQSGYPEPDGIRTENSEEQYIRLFIVSVLKNVFILYLWLRKHFSKKFL